MKYEKIFLLMIYLLAGTGSAFAQLQPGSPWPMIHHDQFHTGRSPHNGPDTSTLKWTFTTGGEILSSPAIAADGTIYILSMDGNLYAIFPGGTERWRFSMPVGESSPAIGADGIIYVGDDVTYFYAVDSTGTEKWTYDMGAITWPSPTIAQDGKIYVSAYGNGTIYAFNPDGDTEWTYSFGGIEWLYESPSIGPDSTIYIRSNDGYLYAFTSTGSLRWQYFIGFSGGGYRGRTSFSVDDNALYTGGKDLYALSPDSTLKWIYPVGSDIYAAPAIGEDGTIYFGTYDGIFYALSSSGGFEWDFITNGGIVSSAAIDSNGTIYFGTLGGDTTTSRVYALNPDGSLFWSRGLPSSIYASPAIGSDGTLYIGCHDGNLYAFGTPTTGTEEGNQLPVFRYKLLQNLPNPFFVPMKGTVIRYGLAKPGEVSLKLYDITGRLVRTLVAGEKKAGIYSISWTGKDSHGNKVASGIYFYRLVSGDFSKTRKMILIR
jgi:outer membrane protein assembly factor BamB